jgi:hypothetical protein
MGSLDRLIEMARHASPVDRLRLERTIAVILRARRAVQLSHQAEQRAWEQLTQAKAASQRRREKDEGPPVELHIFGERPCTLHGPNGRRYCSTVDGSGRLAGSNLLPPVF